MCYFIFKSSALAVGFVLLKHALVFQQLLDHGASTRLSVLKAMVTCTIHNVFTRLKLVSLKVYSNLPSYAAVRRKQAPKQFHLQGHSSLSHINLYSKNDL